MLKDRAEPARGSRVRRSRILVVDDESGVRVGLRRFLQSHGYDVDEAGDREAAEAAFSGSPPDLVILDQKLPDGSGVDLLPRFKEVCPWIPVIVLTAHGSIDLAVRAIKLGAEQFLTKPVDLQAVLVIVERLLADQRNRQKEMAGRPRRGQSAIDPFLGAGAAVRRLEDEARRVLEANRPVLIQGETGTGKGVLARWLHDNGPGGQETFVDLNCAGLSRDLLESELFGHEAGAFTGATRSKPGLLEVAHRGTVFLDEIGDMDAAIQPKLLKVLDQKQFRRLGDLRDRRVDIRLIAATHQDLGVLMQERKFREDLFFRISTLPLRTPPLRERLEDLPALARHFVAQFSVELGRAGVAISEDAVEELRGYRWPGNIRELRSVLERAVLVSEGGVIRARDLRFDLERHAGGSAAVLTLAELERRHIESVLDLEGHHVEKAARRLGISTSSLYERIKKLGTPRSRN